MTLRPQTLLFTGATLLALLGVLFGVSSTILQRNLRVSEAENARQILRGSLNVFNQDIKQFNDQFLDWAAWDDAYAFVQDGNKPFIKSNLSGQSLDILRINLMAFVKPSGQITWGTMPRFANEESRADSGDFEEIFQDRQVRCCVSQKSTTATLEF